MFNHDDTLTNSWYNINSPPASVQSPVIEFTFDDTQHLDQPYPSPAESEQFENDMYNTEQSFDFNHPLAQPIPNSQDYSESHTLADEICEVLFSTDTTLLPMPIDAIKIEYEPDEKADDDVLMHDILLCSTQTIPMAVNMYHTNTNSQDIFYNVRPADVTKPMAIESMQIINQDENISKQQINVEHNYTNQPENINVTSSSSNIETNKTDNFDVIDTLMVVPEKLSHRRRIQPLKLRLNAIAENDKENLCGTAEIISDTLDMENETRFDLIKYIDQPEVRSFLHVLYIYVIC